MLIMRNIILLSISTFLASFVYGYFYWNLARIVDMYGGVGLVAYYFTYASIVMAILTFFSGIISDVIGRKPMVILSAILYALGLSLLLVKSPISLLISIMLMFAATAFSGGSIQALISESSSGSILGRVFSITMFISLVGMSLGSTTLAIISSSFNLETAIIAAVFTLWFCIILRVMLKETRSGDSLSLKEVGFKTLRLIIADEKYYPVVVLMVSAGLFNYFNVYLTLYFDKVLNFNEGLIGSIWALIMISTGLGQPFAGWFTDKYGVVKSYVLGLLMAGIMMVLFVAISRINPFLAVIFIVIQNFTVSLNHVAYNVYIAKVSHVSIRASAYASTWSIFTLASIPAYMIGGALWGIDPTLTLIIPAVVDIAMIMFALRLKHGEYR